MSDTTQAPSSGPARRPYQSQVEGGGNNIPESYLKRFELRGPKRDESIPEGLATFLEDI